MAKSLNRRLILRALLVPLLTIALSLTASLARAHEINIIGDPVAGPGHTSGAMVPIDGKILEFPANNVALMSWMTSEDMTGQLQQANDIWGYVSPKGREYAIVGLFGGTAFVEVTDPERPRVVKFVSGPGSVWRDIAVYREYAYVVNETGSEDAGSGTVGGAVRHPGVRHALFASADFDPTIG